MSLKRRFCPFHIRKRYYRPFNGPEKMFAIAKNRSMGHLIMRNSRKVRYAVSDNLRTNHLVIFCS